MCKELTKTIMLQNVHNTIEETETNLEVLMPEFFKGIVIALWDICYYMYRSLNLSMVFRQILPLDDEEDDVMQKIINYT